MPEDKMLELVVQGLKDHMDTKFEALEKRLDAQCMNCSNTATLKERSRSQWFHIKSLWGVGGTLFILIIGWIIAGVVHGRVGG